MYFFNKNKYLIYLNFVSSKKKKTKIQNENLEEYLVEMVLKLLQLYLSFYFVSSLRTTYHISLKLILPELFFFKSNTSFLPISAYNQLLIIKILFVHVE